jgi:hypothetical protein
MNRLKKTAGIFRIEYFLSNLTITLLMIAEAFK